MGILAAHTRPYPHLHNKLASQNNGEDWKLVTLNREGFSPQEGVSSNPHPFSIVFQAFDLRAACRKNLVEAWTSVNTGFWRKEAGCHTLGLITSPAPERVWPLLIILESHGLSHSCPSRSVCLCFLFAQNC